MPELTLVSRSDPLSVSAAPWGATDATEHVAGDHDQGGDDRADGPGETRLEEGRDVAEGDEEEDDCGGESCELGVVDWRLVGDGDGGVLGELFR